MYMCMAFGNCGDYGLFPDGYTLPPDWDEVGGNETSQEADEQVQQR